MIASSDLADALTGREALFAFLRDHLHWPLDPEDTFTYDEPEVAGRVAARVAVSQLVPFGAADPFGIFLVTIQGLQYSLLLR